MRYGQWTTVMALAASLLGVGASSPTQAAEMVVEKIPLQYIDVRYVAMVLGGSVLPSEADLLMGRTSFGGFGGGMLGGYGGGFLPGNGIFGDPSTNSILVLPNGAYSGGSIYGDPGSNSLLVGPRRGNTRFQGPARGRLYGVPSSNSLLYRR